MFARIIHLWNAMQTSWENDPAARGAAKITLGAVLLFEGIFGAIRNIGEGKSRGGILAGIIGIVVAAVIIFVGSMINIPDANEADRVTTQGIVERHIPSGDLRRSVYSYSVNGKKYELRSGSSSSHPPAIGSQVEISYLPSNPNDAKRADGVDGFVDEWMGTIVQTVGWLMLLTSVFSLTISIVLIVFGIKLIAQGRADRKSAKDDKDSGSGSFISDFISLFSQIKSGQLRVEDTAAGHPGQASGAPSN